MRFLAAMGAMGPILVNFLAAMGAMGPILVNFLAAMGAMGPTCKLLSRSEGNGAYF